MPNTTEEVLPPRTTNGTVRLDHKVITATGKERTRLLAVGIAGAVLILMTFAYIYLIVTKAESPGLLAFIGTGFGLLVGKSWGGSE
jgi:hypothetical protein